jgi:hypothetical protein
MLVDKHEIARLLEKYHGYRDDLRRKIRRNEQAIQRIEADQKELWERYEDVKREIDYLDTELQ